MKKLWFFVFIALVTVACSSEETPAVTPEGVDSTLSSNNPAPDSTSALIDTLAVDSMSYDDEPVGTVSQEEAAAMEAAEQPAVVEGAMDFCECIRASKKIENELMETDDDDRLDELMAENDALRAKCPDLTNPGQQMSLDAKEEYQRRVNRCLK